MPSNRMRWARRGKGGCRRLRMWARPNAAVQACLADKRLCLGVATPRHRRSGRLLGADRMLETGKNTTRMSWGDQVAAERVRGLYRSAPVGVLSALFGVGILCWVLIHTDPALTDRVLWWLGATTAIALGQLVLC